MSLLAYVKSTLNATFKEFDSLSTFKLKEPANIHGCKEVIIKTKFPNALVYKADVTRQNADGHNIDNFPFFENGNPKRICDYIIFYERDNTLYVFACELKSNNTDGSKNQLYAGLVLSNYFVNTAIRCNKTIQQKIKYKAILFSTTGVYKQMTVDKYFLEIHGTHYGEILGNEEYDLDAFCH